jgi:hypothetical protein
MNYINVNSFKFRELGPNCFIWLPLKSVPVVDREPVNSLKQPALSIFNLAEWSAREKLLTDDQKYLDELASQYDEMGYFLIHIDRPIVPKPVFGIIGITLYHACGFDGRATIFNAREVKHGEIVKDPVNLKVVNTNLEMPFKKAVYKKHDIIGYRAIHDDIDVGRGAFDD